MKVRVFAIPPAYRIRVEVALRLCWSLLDVGTQNERCATNRTVSWLPIALDETNGVGEEAAGDLSRIGRDRAITPLTCSLPIGG